AYMCPSGPARPPFRPADPVAHLGHRAGITVPRLRALGLGCTQRRARDGQSRYHHTDEALAPRDAVATPAPSSGPGGSLHAIPHTASGLAWGFAEKFTLTDRDQTASQRTLREDYARGSVCCDVFLHPDIRTTIRALIAAMRQWRVIPRAAVFDNGTPC